MILMMAGLPGTGKSTLARALAARLNGAVLDKDPVRAALFLERVAYTAEQDDFVQELLLQTAAYLLARDPALHVFLDGRTFSQEYQRRRVIDFCTQLGARLAIIECICPEDVAIVRLTQAAAEGTHPAANRTPELYRRVRDTWQTIEDAKLVIDTGAGLKTCVERALRYIHTAIAV